LGWGKKPPYFCGMGRRIKPFNTELEVIDTAVDGRGIAKHGERIVFVEKAVPGDKVDAHIFRKEKKALVARIEEIQEASPHRIEPRCEHFGICGGCKWQHMSYEAQLEFKQKHVENAIIRIGKVEPKEKLPILACEKDLFYRNKLEFTASKDQWLTGDEGALEDLDQRVLGFHVPRVFYKIVNIENCQLQLPIVNEIRNEVRDFAREHEIPFYDHREHTGSLRSLVFRSSLATGELMVILILADGDKKKADAVFTHLEKKFPQITDFLWIHNPKKNSSYTDLDFQVWKGKSYITEKLGKYSFQIRANSFFQTNPRQAEALYEVVREFLVESLGEKEKVNLLYDLYSGTGSIGIFVSDYAEKVVGIEYVNEAIEDAKENVKLNQLEDKFSFYAGDMKKILNQEFIAEHGKPEILIADPPRAGMDPKVVNRILEMAPEHIIYVSCKASTQARDIALLKENYELLKIQPVDMFPQTAHVENVALLRRISD